MAEYPNPWGWNPRQYCGLPTQFTYLPGLPYLLAFSSKLIPSAPVENIYRVVTGLAACLIPASVFLLSMTLLRSRSWAVAAGAACTVLSPLYLLFRVIDRDRGLLEVPWRLNVLLKYGEGPHILALAFLPLAIAAVWRAAGRRSFPNMFLASVLLAFVPLTNWIAAMALAISCICLIAAYAGEGSFRIERIIAAGVLAWLLAAFWLTPSYIQVTAFNWPVDALNYKLQAQQRYMILGFLTGLVLIRLAFFKFSNYRYLCFLCLATYAFGYLSTGYYVWRMDTIPESRRYVMEFEIFLILLLLEWIRVGLRHREAVFRGCTAGAALVLLIWESPEAYRYLSGGWKRWHVIPKEQTIEYRIAKWLEKAGTAGRVYASGGLRYRLNQWTGLHQVGGGFETGLRNRVPLHFGYQIRAARGDRPGEMPDETLLQIRALGVEYVVVHGLGSSEYYKDFQGLQRFPLIGREVFRDGPDAVFRMDDWATAHLVLAEELPPERPLWGAFGHAYYYVLAMDDLGRPQLRLTWNNTSEFTVSGEFPQGMLVSAAVNFDPGWKAWQDGQPVPVKENNMGFITVQPRPSPGSRIEFRYEGTLEQRLMAAVSAIAWIGSLVCLAASRRRSAK